MAKPTPTSSLADKELAKAEEQFKAFDENIKEMTLDRMNTAPKQETAPQVERSQAELARTKDIYLKPFKSVSSPQKFNENFRADYEYDKQYVQFEAENNEIIGEEIEMWTRPYGGMPAEFWKVPVNKPVWGPRYLAEQIKRKSYHRLKMDNAVITETHGMGQMYGTVAVDSTVQRLDARPVIKKKALFFGSPKESEFK